MKLRRALVVVKRTALSKLAKDKRVHSRRIRKLVEQRDASVLGILEGHEEHVASVKHVKRVLKERGVDFKVQSTIPRGPVSGYDLIVPVGGDGMVLGCSHAVRDKTPVLGVNSEPSFSVGYLSGCTAATFGETLDDLAAGTLEPLTVQRLRVSIGQRVLPEPVLNDVLFCADNPAQMCRYRLIWPDGTELQRSSGVWISTPAGSTSALASAGGPILPLTAKQLAFLVREPYSPPGAAVRVKSAVLVKEERLGMECLMEGASVFLDGSHRRYRVEFGQRVWFRLGTRPLYLVRQPPG
ncbi:MAG: NAD(+)/NADH kinase [Deltaproteobacteria bacterium]